MKKLIFLLLVVLIAVSLYFFLPETKEDHSYQSFISSDAQIVITQYDLQQRVDEMAQSPIGKALDSLEYELIGQEFNMDEADIDNFLQTKQNIAELFNHPLLKNLFGTEVTCALFPFTYREDIRLEDQLLNNILVIARPKHGAKLIDVAQWLEFSSQTMTTSRYGRHTITRYDVDDGQRISGVRMNDLLILSLNEAVVRRSLDVYDGEGANLFEVGSYSDHIDRFSGASLITYVNFPEISSQLDEVTSESTGNGQIVVLDKNVLAPYQTGLFGAWRHEDRIVDQAVITFSPDLLNDEDHTRLKVPARESQSFGKVGNDTILYHWTNQFDFSYLMKIAGETETDGSFSDSNPIPDFLRVTGLSAEQISGLFTGDLTLAMEGLKNNQLVPLPRFVLSVKTNNPDLLKSSTEKIIDHYSIPVRRKKIGQNGELISWGGIIGIGSVLPAFAFNEDDLIISSNHDEIKKFIVPGESQPLLNSEQFKIVSDELLKPSNSITYVQFSQLTEMIKEMASWGGTMIAIKDRELARKSKLLIDELINPILDGLAMYKVIGSRKYISDNMIIFESQTILENGKQ